MKPSAFAALLEILWDYFERTARASSCSADGEYSYRGILLVNLKAIREFMTRIPSLAYIQYIYRGQSLSEYI